MNAGKALLVGLMIVTVFRSVAASDSDVSVSPYDDIFTLRFAPGVSIPVGSSNSDYFKFGINGDLIADFVIPPISPFFLSAGVGYTLSPIDTGVEGMNLNMINASAGFNAEWPLAPKLQIGAFVRGGYTYGFMPDPDDQLTSNVWDPEKSGSTWHIATGASLKLRVYRGFSVGIDAGYRYFAGLYGDIVLAIGLTYHHRPKSERKGIYGPDKLPLESLELSDVTFIPVFPVFYKYYDDHPVGALRLENTGTTIIENLQVSFFVKEYMDNQKLSGTVEELAPGDSLQMDLFGLFTQDVLTISEATKVSANIIVESESGGQSYVNEAIETLRLYDRNSMTWEDDRRAAAFVTLKDPTVLKFSRYVSGQTRDLASRALNKQMLSTLGMMEAMRLYELSYVIDPSSPYKDLSLNTSSTDYLQFPVQTLEYKSGDCDDLSILFCALLESVGVETAFVTIPGHIFTAVNLNMAPRDAEKSFNRPEDLIFIEGETWLPVEVTLVRSGFLTAWEQGAKQWREYDVSGQAGFFPVRDAWDLYEPVGFSSQAADIELPSEDEIVDRYLSEVSKFVDRDIFARVSFYEEKVRNSGGAPADVNRLGILFARYGKNEEAKDRFVQILQDTDYPPALMNMGNILYLEEEYFDALDYYERAFELDNDNPKVLVGLARVHHELENYSYVRKYYRELKNVDPSLSERFAYLELRQEEVARASNLADEKDVMLWDE